MNHLRSKFLRPCLLASAAFLLCAPASAQTGAQGPVVSGDIYSKKSVRAVMQKVFEWQVANPVQINTSNTNLWARAAFYAGVMSVGRATGDRRYYEQAARWADSRGWKLGDRPRHADDHAPGQTDRKSVV
jgi:hypothetical protein